MYNWHPKLPRSMQPEHHYVVLLRLVEPFTPFLFCFCTTAKGVQAAAAAQDLKGRSWLHRSRVTGILGCLPGERDMESDTVLQP